MKTLAISTPSLVFLFWAVLILALALPIVALGAAANVSLDSGVISGTLDTGNGVLVGEVSFDTTTGEFTESHCLSTPGHTSGDICD